MAWKLATRRDAKQYADPKERIAFSIGYADAWYGLMKDVSSPHTATTYPNAYSAGYWEGHADRKEPDL